jgi:hypothetical protein
MRLRGQTAGIMKSGEVRTHACCVTFRYDVEASGPNAGSILVQETEEVRQHDVASCDCRCHEVYKRWGG